MENNEVLYWENEDDAVSMPQSFVDEIKIKDAESTAFFIDSKKEIAEAIKSIEDVNLKELYLKKQLNELLNRKIEYTLNSSLKNINNYNSEEIANDLLIALVKQLIFTFNEINEVSNESLIGKKFGKIKWNEQKNVLIDLVYQLKRLCNNKKEPLIPNSNEDLAVFLKESFACFEDTKLSTILFQLNSSQRPIKTEKRIIVTI